MEIDDIKNEIIMYFKQIKVLSEMMLETDNVAVENVLTINGLAENGLQNAEQMFK